MHGEQMKILLYREIYPLGHITLSAVISLNIISGCPGSYVIVPGRGA